LALVAAILLGSTVTNVLGGALIVDVARLHAAGLREVIGALERALLVWWAGGILAVAVSSMIFQAAVQSLFHVIDTRLITLTIVGLAANALLLPARALLQATGRFGAFAWSNAAEGLAKIASAAVVVLRPTLLTGVGSFAAALIIAAALTVAFIFPDLREPQPQRRYRLLDSARDALPLLAAIGGLTMMTFVDGIIARYVFSPEQAGLYNAVALAGRALMTVLAFLPSVLLAKVVEQREGDHSVARTSFMFAGAGSLVAVVIFALIPRTILALVGGNAFLDGSPLVALYGIAAAALSLALLVGSYRIARGAAWLGPAIVAIAACEVVAMSIYHPTPAAMVHVVVAGHATALIVASLPAKIFSWGRHGTVF